MSCGNSLILGWSCETVKDRGFKRTRKERLAQADYGTKCVKMECSICSVITSVEAKKLKPSRAQRGRGIKTANATPTTSPSVAQPQGLPDVEDDQFKNAKKRTRGRNSSLQSMMANQRSNGTQASTGFGLKLQDFRKS
jgi:hypothetical protein